MKLARIDVRAADARSEELEAAVYGLGAQGLEILDASCGAPRGEVIVRFYVPLGREVRTSVRALERTLDDVRIEVSDVTFDDASNASGASTRRASLLGKRFRVGGSTRYVGPRTTLLLDGASAFGDGAHPTTRLVVEAMEAHVAPRRHRRALDVGTGTGVLALVALELGVRDVVATDVDPLARAAARALAARHGMGARFTVRATLPRDTFPLVVANLYRDVLLELAPKLAARVAPRGTLVVSGFGPASKRDVRLAFETQGLALVRARTRASWCAFVFAR